VSITTNPKEGGSSEDTLAAISQALEEIARAAPQPALPSEAIFEGEDAPQRSDRHTLAAILDRLRPDGLPSWSLIGGLLAVVCIGIIVLVWPSPDGRAAKPIVPPSVDAAKASAGLQQPSIQVQTTPQRASLAEASAPPELTQSVQTIVRELANLTQGVEQLKTRQAQMARDNAELAGNLKETQEQMARHNAELGADLKAAQEEMTRDNLSMAAQLKASQEQIAAMGEQLKATQEQLNRLAAPRPRPPKLASPFPQQPNVTLTPKPAPKQQPPQAGRLPNNSSQSQPKQP
jgi:hypothetical protein